MKKVLSIVLSLILLVGIFAACGQKNDTSAANEGDDKAAGNETAKKDAVKIKIANIYGADTPESKSMFKFKEILEEKSGGSVVVEVYPNAQLGNEETLVDSVRQGSVEFVVVGTMMAQYVPLVSVPEFPFLFDNWDQAKTALTSDTGKELAKGADEAGIEFLGWTPVAFRAISSNFEISSMEDLQGMRLRMPNIPTYMEFAKNIGANPIAMSISELFTSLEQKVVDGQDNPYSVFKANKFYEVQPYVLDSRHMFCTHAWYANKQFLADLSDEDRAVVIEAADEAMAYSWDLTQEQESEDMKYLEENGIKITIPDDEFKKQMRDSQIPTREWFYNEYPGSQEFLEKFDAMK